MGHRILKSDFYPIGFCNIGLHNKKTDPFIRSKSKNLKLGIESRKNLPYFDLTMWWYRVDVPILTGTGLLVCFTELSEVSGTDIDVVSIPVPTQVQMSIPVPEVPVLMPYQMSGIGIDVVPNLP